MDGDWSLILASIFVRISKSGKRTRIVTADEMVRYPHTIRMAATYCALLSLALQRKDADRRLAMDIYVYRTEEAANFLRRTS